MVTDVLKVTEENALDKPEIVDGLFEEHWDEIAKNKELMELLPDYDKYNHLYETGILKTLVAREGVNIVGYSFNLVDTHLHYRKLVVCYNDLIFLKKEYRKGIYGLKLMKATEEWAKNEWGADMMLWHVKENTPVARILERKKYSVQDIIYSKVLK